MRNRHTKHHNRLNNNHRIILPDMLRVRSCLRSDTTLRSYRQLISAQQGGRREDIDALFFFVCINK